MEALADPAFWVCAGAVVAGAFIQGTGGLGFAMFAAPVAALLHPELVPGPMLMLGGTVSLLAATREPASIDYRFAGIAIAGRVTGSVVAGLVIGLAPKSVFAVAFAVLILIAVALSLAVPRVKATPAMLSVAGFGSGLMGTITSVGAPPMGLVLQNESPARVRATMGAFLTVGAIVSVAVLAWAGRFGMRELTLGAILLLPMAIGFALSSRLVKHVDTRIVRRIVLGVSAVSAVILLVQNLKGA
jgi:uncharacterized membrane protein YfcA